MQIPPSPYLSPLYSRHSINYFAKHNLTLHFYLCLIFIFVSLWALTSDSFLINLLLISPFFTSLILHWGGRGIPSLLPFLWLAYAQTKINIEVSVPNNHSPLPHSPLICYNLTFRILPTSIQLISHILRGFICLCSASLSYWYLRGNFLHAHSGLMEKANLADIQRHNVFRSLLQFFEMRTREFLSDHSQESCGWWCYEWVDPNRLRHATGKCVGSSSIYPIYRQHVWAGWEQTMCLSRWLHTTGSCLQSSKQPYVAASLNIDLARIQEWCNHWCMILNPNITKVLAISRSRTANPPYDDLVLSGISIFASPNLDILGISLTESSPLKTMCVVLFPTSLWELLS